MPKRVVDYSLIQSILNGNKNQFYFIIEEFEDQINYHLLKMINDKEVAKDLTNEVFIKAYLNLNKFKSGYKFSSWLYKIATNTAIDYIRNKKILPDIIKQTENHNEVADFNTPEDILQTTQNYATLSDAINKLPSVYRNIIKLRYFKEMSYEEIASTMKMPIGTVKAYIHRAKLKLSQLIKQ